VRLRHLRRRLELRRTHRRSCPRDLHLSDEEVELFLERSHLPIVDGGSRDDNGGTGSRGTVKWRELAVGRELGGGCGRAKEIAETWEEEEQKISVAAWDEREEREEGGRKRTGTLWDGSSSSYSRSVAEAGHRRAYSPHQSRGSVSDKLCVKEGERARLTSSRHPSRHDGACLLVDSESCRSEGGFGRGRDRVDVVVVDVGIDGVVLHDLHEPVGRRSKNGEV
jgi:hypothetical protein